MRNEEQCNSFVEAAKEMRSQRHQRSCEAEEASAKKVMEFVMIDNVIGKDCESSHENRPNQLKLKNWSRPNQLKNWNLLPYHCSHCLH